MWAIAGELSLAGLTARLHRTRGVLDLTATMRQPGRRETDVVLDEDGYTELRYWADPHASPAEVAYAITSALAAVTRNLARSAHAASRSMPGRTGRPITGYDGAVTECAGDGTMPGPPDQLTEPGQSPESVRPRESDPVDAELRQRMEQLRPGHPSSPYKGDGSPKPPVPDPFKNELPIPGDPNYHPDTPSEPQADLATDKLSDGAEAADASPKDSGTDRSLDAEDKPRVDPDGSWEWKGFPLSPDEAQLADQRLARCHEAEGRDADGRYAEHGLTPAMRRVEADLGHGKLVPNTEEFALKSADRFKEKLAKMISDESDADPRELVSRIHDGVRYTFRFPEEEYSSGVMEVCNSLSFAGFELYERKNAWADEAKSYKGVNSTWMDHDSGVLFEVQIHTSASWDAKQESHRQYEIIESRISSFEEKSQARERQDQIFARVPAPEGVMEIPTYRKEGW